MSNNLSWKCVLGMSDISALGKKEAFLFKESALRPILSSSRDVSLYIYLSVYISVPSPCNFIQGLSLALRLHDQIPASHWSTPQNRFKEFGGN